MRVLRAGASFRAARAWQLREDGCVWKGKGVEAWAWGRGGAGGSMRKAGARFWQAPTALDLPPRGGGGAQEASAHSPAHQHTLWKP